VRRSIRVLMIHYMSTVMGEFFSSPKRSNRYWAPLGLIFNSNPSSFPSPERPELEFDYSPPVLRLRISGAVPLLPLCAFMSWVGKTFPFTVALDIVHFLFYISRTI
jgi:hypothetical protein